MNYHVRLKYHFQPEKGWMNDPNGLCRFGEYYHAFYQAAPDHEQPWKMPMNWGHARSKDLIVWEQLPLALKPDQPYDAAGCWSGTAIEKDGILYMYYASVSEDADGKRHQAVSVAYTEDGEHFEKYAGNPVIASFPEEGSEDFRDPSVIRIGDDYYLVVASGHPATKTANLLLYKSADMLHWDYKGVLCEWADSTFCECPSFMQFRDGYLLTVSVVSDKGRYFSLLYGDFDGEHFTIKSENRELFEGPDQYAGQVFKDKDGRALLMTWIPGWDYAAFTDKSLGCLSVPIEILYEDGKLKAYPSKEALSYFKTSDDNIEMTESGFVIKRDRRPDVVYQGEIRELRVLKDEYVLEIFLNGGEKVFTVILA